MASRDDAYLGHTPGVWIATAADLRDGIFYRPLFGADGYGGSRYFPLHFVVHAGLMRLGVEVRKAGYALDVVSTALLILAVYIFLRRWGSNRMIAAVCGLLVLAAGSGQKPIVQIRGDALPAALNIWGLALCATEEINWRKLLGAGTLFSLAFAAKETTIFGVAAVVCALLLQGKARQASKLVGVTAAGFAVVLMTMYVFSHGRVFEIFVNCASGGATFHDIVRGPFTLLYFASHNDPIGLMFIVLGASVLFAVSRDTLRKVPAVFWLSTAVVTCVIFGSPGTTQNHLLDLHVASVLLVGAWLTGAEKSAADVGWAALAVMTVVALYPTFFNLLHDDRENRRAAFSDVLRIVGNTGRPILSENPLLPVLAGQRAYMLDPFFFRVLSEKNPSFATPLWQGLRDHTFSAVILEQNPYTAEGKDWYAASHFGSRFIRELETSYQLVGETGHQFIFKPNITDRHIAPISGATDP